MSIFKFSLTGKVAIVTGGKGGIGRAIALGLAEAGADVAICGRLIEDGQLGGVAEEIQQLGRRSLAIKADVSRKGDVENLVQRVMDELGAIDILVNNAGIMIKAPLLETTEAAWNEVMDIDLKGFYLCSQAVGRKMVERRKGNIINIASVFGIRAVASHGAYPIAKAGVIMLTRVLALELGSYGIRVNAIAPGLTKTEMTRAIWSDPEALRHWKSMKALGRIGEPNDFVGAVLYLASDASSYVTGETILINGGSKPT